MNKGSFLLLPHRPASRGAALVVVLSTLVLLVGLVVAILLRVTSARAVSSSYSAGITNRVLADTAVNMVLGQIQDATSDTTQTLSWASQPGAISNFNTKGFAKGYKLFSSTQMQSTDEAEFRQSFDTNWKNKPGQYVNLNSPVTKNGKKIYPIADPVLLNSQLKGSQATHDDYVDGFAVDDPTSDLQKNLEMPVEWLYVRKDGTISTGLYNTGTGAVDLSGTSKEPVVARVAFWTDDESAKVNINTASEGFAWDTPRYTTFPSPPSGDPNDYKNYLSDTAINTTRFDDSNFAKLAYKAIGLDGSLGYNQPARNEFNRFPGHPAMTSMSPVFPFLTPNQIFQLAPRLESGGSWMGTRSTVNRYASINGYADADRLYDSPAEYAIRSQPFSTTNPVPTDKARLVNGQNMTLPDGSTDAGNTLLTPDKVRERSFLLTASSRAPELNLFGRPRVVMWPVFPSKYNTYRTGGGLARTSFDELIAFCGTLRDSINVKTDSITNDDHQWPFVFFRKYPYAGFGGPNDPSDNDGTTPSNVHLFEYLDDVTGRATPGFGDSLAHRYGRSDCDQILAEMLDYIRCTNIFDTYLEGDSYQAQADNAPPTSAGEYTNGTIQGNTTHGKPGRGQVLPLHIKGFRGMGRTPTVSEVALHIICTADYDEGGNGHYDHTYPNALVPVTNYRRLASNNGWNITLGPTIGAPDPKDGEPKRALLTNHNERMIQAMLHVELAGPMNGYPTIAPNLEVEVKGVGNFAINGNHLFRSSGSLRTYDPTPLSGGLKEFNSEGFTYWQGVATGGYMGIGSFVFLSKFYNGRIDGIDAVQPGSSAQPDGRFLQNDGDLTVKGDTRKLSNHPFISNPIHIADASKPLNITGSQDITIDLWYPPDGSNGNTRQHIQTVHMRFPDTTSPCPNLVRGSGPSDQFPERYKTSWVFNRDGYAGPPNTFESVEGRLCQTLGSGWTDAERARLAINYIYNPQNFVTEGSPGRNDVVRSVELRDGDFRYTSLLDNVQQDKSGPFFVQTKPLGGDEYMAHSLTDPYFFQLIVAGGYNTRMNRIPGRSVASHPGDPQVSAEHTMDIPAQVDYIGPQKQTPAMTGDWDSGVGAGPDGPFANMPDAGDFARLNPGNNTIGPPYYFFPDQDTGAMAKGFSPNRQIPSSGMFGSLPVGINGGSWRTLLFRPQVGHPGYIDPFTFPAAPAAPDYLFMDLFWMPVVQPYAISEPFSTAGKINMNYQLMPFDYIKRKTPMYAVLKAERMLAIPNNQGLKYRDSGGNATIQNYPTTFRVPIDIPATLDQFDLRFKPLAQGGRGTIFRSATEICDQYLVTNDSGKTGNTANSMEAFWKNHAVNGDNVRERPYANIYPRLTTQSNTFQVHYMVQTVKQTSNHPATFVDPDSTSTTGAARPLADAVTGQLRGSRLIERYLNSTDARFVKGGSGSSTSGTIDPRTDSLNGAYKVRVYGEMVFPP